MKIGTKSLLIGAHCFFMHPFFVAVSWLKLYGFSSVTCGSSGVTTSFFDWRLWLCFVVHDWGYFGKPNMDGEEGEMHPITGANILWRFTGKIEWYNFCKFHSRFLARRAGCEPSLFCWADKLAIALTPSWIYIPLTTMTGELSEYMNVNPREVKGYGKTSWQWHRECRSYCRKIAFEHRDGRADTWTPRLSDIEEIHP